MFCELVYVVIRFTRFVHSLHILRVLVTRFIHVCYSGMLFGKTRFKLEMIKSEKSELKKASI